MIVTQEGGELLLFTQADHAALASAILALWRDDGLKDHPHRQELLLAVREHDNGWREADAVPRVDPARGRPLDFREVSAADRIEIWRRGVRRFGTDNPRAALLILRHAERIHEEYEALDGWQDFFDELRARRRELEEGSAIEPSTIECDYRFLEIADALSLGACGAFGAVGAGRSQTRQVGGYRFQASLGRIALEPFPLAGATTLEVAHRISSSTPGESSADFLTRLISAPWQRLPVRVEPL